MPAMNIVIMIVGTRGDVQPFFGLGKLTMKNSTQNTMLFVAVRTMHTYCCKQCNSDCGTGLSVIAAV